MGKEKSDLEYMAREILSKFGTCQYCAGEVCDEVDPETGDPWIQHLYLFQKDSLTLDNWKTADGIDDIRIRDRDQIVCIYQSYDRESYGRTFYVDGDWEQDLKKLYEELFLTQLTLF